MIVTARRRLQQRGVLSHKELLEDLNVKRWSAIISRNLWRYPIVDKRVAVPDPHVGALELSSALNKTPQYVD